MNCGRNTLLGPTSIFVKDPFESLSILLSCYPHRLRFQSPSNGYPLAKMGDGFQDHGPTRTRTQEETDAKKEIHAVSVSDQTAPSTVHPNE